MKKRTARKWLNNLLSLGLVGLLVVQGFVFVSTPTKVVASARPHGDLKRVIVQFRGEVVNSNASQPVEDQVSELASRRKWLDGQLRQMAGYKEIVLAASQMPIVIMNVDAAGEQSLKQNPNVVSVSDDEILHVDMMDAIPLIGGSVSTGFSDGSTNFTGDGKVVAVIDTGVDKDHTLLSGSVVSEACYSLPSATYGDGIITSACPGEATSSTATGSAAPCDVNVDDTCSHGTSVAGAALMRSGTLSIDRDGAGGDPAEDVDVSGVAKGADLIAIKVVFKLTEINGQGDLCGDAGNTTESCFRPSVALSIMGFDRVLALQNAGTLDNDIVSANVSLGSSVDYYSDTSSCVAAGGNSTSAATYQSFVTAALSLKQANIAPIVAAGNSGDGENQDKLGAPACLANVIGVSASTKTDSMASYSNAGPLTKLVAPGGDYSGSGDPYAQMLLLPEPDDLMSLTAGTSFAAPMVAGAWATLREKAPTASVDTLLSVLQDTGTDVTEDRSGYTTLTHSRIALDDALAALTGLPSITTVTPPTGSITGGSSVNVTVTAENATSCQAYSGSTSVGSGTVTDGQATIAITAPTNTGTATYRIECVGANSTMAQQNVSFTVTTAGTQSGGNTDSSSEWIPGVPSAGQMKRTRLVITMILSVLAILYLQRGLVFGVKRSKR